MATEQHVDGKFTFFLLLSHNQSLSAHSAVYHVHNCGCLWTQKIQVQIKGCKKHSASPASPASINLACYWKC